MTSSEIRIEVGVVGADAAGRQALSQLLCQAYDGELKGNGAFGGFGRRQVDVPRMSPRMQFF